jgi:Putative Ig domain
MAFTQVQNGSAITGSTSGGVGTLTLTLPAGSTAGTLLVACIETGQAGTPMKISAVTTTAGANPNTSPGWEWCCTSVNGSGLGGQQAEIWCYRKNPGGITSTTWTVQSSGGTRGHMMEFSTTLAYQVMELFPGLNTAVTAGDTSFPVAMGNPVSSGELAVALFADNFTTGTLNTWTTPSGWTLGRSTSGQTIQAHWASYYKTTAAAGAVSVTGVASTSTNQVGWEAALVVFREASSVRARVGGSCSAGTYNDQGSFGLPSTKMGSAAEADIFVGRTMFGAAQVSYQQEGDHLTTGPTPDQTAMFAAGVQICWAMKPRRTGLSGFTSVADEQAAVDQDLTLVKQAGITGWFCTSYNEHNLGGGNGPFGNDTSKPGPDPYGNVGTGATADNAAKKNWLTYWANYQPTYAAHGIPIYTKPSYASPNSCSSWHPPAGTVSGVMADFYYSDSSGKSVYLDASPATGVPSLQDVCDGTKNPDNASASNTPIPLGLGEWGRAGGSSTPAWSLVVAWSHTGGSTGHVRDLFAARLTANKQNGPLLWFENNLGGPNWLHVPGVNGEDQSGILAELAACADNLAPQAAGTTVVVTTTSLPNAVLGAAYSQTLQVTGGAAPYTWALLTGSLPTGLSLSSAGVISGTPSVAGTSTFTVKATDAGSNIGNSGSLSIVVPGISVTTTTLPAASLGVAYSQTLTESGGTGPFTWTITTGTLPAGITLSAAGVLSGTTGASPGTYGFTVTVTDSLANTSPPATLTLLVSAGSTGGGTPAVLPPGFPQVIVEAGFYSAAPVAQPGTLILDDPTFGDLDSAFLADSTAWTNITTFVRSGTISRASTRVQGPLRTYQAGTASVTLKNADGRFDPDNTAGPYVIGSTSNIRPMVPVRIRAIWANVEYHLFQGFIDTWNAPDTNYGPRYAETTASATDGFKILAGITLPPQTSSGNGEASGARIARILSAAGWYTDHRRIDPGDTELQATGYGDTALNLLQLTADTEIGELYIDGAGNVVFRERRAILEDTRSVVSQATFGDQGGTQLPYQAVGRANDDTTLANDVQITRAGGTLQEATDPASVAAYLFPRSYSRDDVLLESDAEALAYAQWVLDVSLAGEDRFDTITLTPLRDVRLWPHVLGREIGDRITIVRSPPGMAAITKDVFIRGITHTVDYSSNTWQTVWDLQDASKYAGFLILDDTTKGKVSSGNKLAY